MPWVSKKKLAKGIGSEGRPDGESTKGRGEGVARRPHPNMPLTGWSTGVLGAAPETPPGEPGKSRDEVAVVKETWETGQVELATGACSEGDNLGRAAPLTWRDGSGKRALRR